MVLVLIYFRYKFQAVETNHPTDITQYGQKSFALISYYIYKIRKNLYK